MELLADDIYKLLIAFAMGLAIGFEREYRSKSAGLRTMILITVGSTLFTILSIKISADAGRIAANIVTGIGFIGAGIIFRENSRVVGITTAAAVWVAAALGMGIGAGQFLLTLFCFVLSGISLVMLTPLQLWIRKKNQIRTYTIKSFYKKRTLKKYEELYKQFGLKILESEQTRSESYIRGMWILQGTEKKHDHVTTHLLNDPEILEFNF